LQVNDLAWTANPNYLLAATGGSDGVGSVDVMSLVLSDAAQRAVPPNVSSLSLASSAPSGTSVISGNGAEELLLLDSVAGHVSNCVSMRTDAGMRRLAVGGLDHCVSLWSLDDLVCLHTLNIEYVLTVPALAPCFYCVLTFLYALLAQLLPCIRALMTYARP
jgi:WD40 repeat protein